MISLWILGFLFTLPLQLGRHFWFPFSYLWGLPVDYLAPTFYLSDFFFLGWLVTSLYQYRPQIKVVLFWLIFATVNIIFSQNWQLASFSWLRFSQLPLLVWLIRRQKISFQHFLSASITGWLILEAFFALLETLRQGSAGTWGWWFGERSFSLVTPGIAKLHLGGRLLLRPYATFPHPNALAGFTLVAFLLLLSLQPRRLLVTVAGLATTIILLLTASHLVWAIAVLIILTTPRRWLALPLLIPLILIPPPLTSWQHRWQLFRAALLIWQHHPLFGVGLGNFLPQLPHFWPFSPLQLWLQPVHNLYLLWLSQTGFWGLLILWPEHFWSRNRFWQLAGLAILLSGLGDHYWLTSQQNFLLLGIWVGLANS